MGNNGKGIYFNSKNIHIGDKEEYVVWLDIMGIQSAMVRSLHTSANFIFKLHIAALESKKKDDGVRLYPVMDGMYIVSEKKAVIKKILEKVMMRLIEEFNKQSEHKHRFLARASIAKGYVIHGDTIGDETSDALVYNSRHKDSIVLGMPVIFAYKSEKEAPPFGVSLHYSAVDILDSDDLSWSYKWWRWFKNSKKLDAFKSFKKNIKDYFRWCSERGYLIEYDKNRMQLHCDMVNQYFFNDSPLLFDDN